MYFAEATSLSVLSGDKNSVYINDIYRKKSFRFDFLEYPDAAFGLNLAANKKTVDLDWSSSQSSLIKRYDIQAALRKEGPYKTIAKSTNIKQSLAREIAGEYNWFRIVSVSGHGLSGEPSAAKENTFRRISVLHATGEYAEAIKLADRLLMIAPGNADARDLLGESLYETEDYTRSIAEFKQLEDVEGYRNKSIRFQVQLLFF